MVLGIAMLAVAGAVAGAAFAQDPDAKPPAKKSAGGGSVAADSVRRKSSGAEGSEEMSYMVG